jgi:hypothetical protein
MFIRRVVFMSLMSLWDREVALIGTSDLNVSEERSFRKRADQFFCLQKEWENLKAGEGIMRPCNGLDMASPLSTAAAYGFEHTVRYMLVKGALVNGLPQSDLMSFRGNPLIRAARYGHKHIMRTLIEFGAKINIRVPEYRCSTLLTAADYSGTSVFEYLLDEVKVDTNVIDAFGCTVVSSLHPIYG